MFRKYLPVHLSLFLVWMALTASPLAAQALNTAECASLPTHSVLQAALKSVVSAGNNGGLGFNMWATIVNRDGLVCQVAFSGSDRGAQWPASRAISAQKANTANSLSLKGLALSTANLYSAVQPGGSLFGLQDSNPVNTEVAYQGPATRFGQSNDPMRGGRIGGVNVFGGGLALYDGGGNVVGGLGVSGDTSCTDHNIAWKLRDALGLDNVAAGVSATGDDNIVNDITMDPMTGNMTSAGGFGHPACDPIATAVAGQLPTQFPVGP